MLGELAMIDFDDPKRKECVNKVISKIQEQNIKLAHLQFIDVNGLLKSFSVSTKFIENSLADGQYFDGSSITGMGRMEESDMVAIPDPSTFAVIPWLSKDLSTCRFICDIYTPARKPYNGDPRFILKKAVETAKKEGFIYKCAPELEFFILEENESVVPTPMDFSGYFDLHPSGISEDIRRKMADAAESFGIDIEVAHHEVAVGQNEIDFRYDEAMVTADRAVTMKMIIKSIAKQNGFLATFMPKPFYGVNGSGMHVHQSLWSMKGDNMFFAPDNEKSGYLSDIALYYIGGQLAHGREMSAVLASWPNSYKRLVPGYEAPVYMAWAHKNRSPLIRVPDFGKRKNAARIEIRCPDPAGNPYLQFAVLLHAGLDGIKKKIMPPDPTELNVYKLTYEERRSRGIISLPESLSEALRELEASELMRSALLGAYQNFLDAKWKEWDEFRTQVSSWELERYLQKL
jgi:glutamine synthetase